MGPFEQMEIRKSSFTKKEMLVYKIIHENIDDILRGSATSIAEQFDISQSAITRFCQKIGYQGFNDFKFDVYKYQKSVVKHTTESSVYEYYSRLINLIPELVSDETFEKISKHIVASRFVSVVGYHKSSLPAQLLNLNLSKLSILSSYIPFDQTHTLPQFLSEKDVVIIFSVTINIQKDFIDSLFDIPDGKRPIIILISMAERHILKNKVDEFIWLPNYRNQNFPVYTESQIVFMVFVDVLTNNIAKIKTEEETE
ncbi:MAG: MurR/RpiR family transcriptional regulator [Anaerorhabdus sp.]